jgi:hypothetical protein
VLLTHGVGSMFEITKQMYNVGNKAVLNAFATINSLFASQHRKPCKKEVLRHTTRMVTLTFAAACYFYTGTT